MREKKQELASFVLISLLLASIFAGAVSGAGVGGAEEEVDNITIKEAEEMLNSRNVVVLDVRSQAEYESGHITGAKLMPVSELEERFDGLDKGKNIIVYCGSGGRSAKASEILVKYGFENVYCMLGGITAWIDAGLPTTSFANTQTPIMPNNNSLSSGIDDLLDDKPVFLFFYTDWCHFCHQQLPIIDELETEYAGKTAFIRINVNERPDYAEEFGVSALPTMFIISGKNEGGYVKHEFSGFTEKTKIRETIALGGEDESDDVGTDINVKPLQVAENAKNCGGAITCSCGDTVTSDYTFEDDLNCSYGSDGLIVGADGIHINGNGHTLRGEGSSDDALRTVGIENSGYDYVTISNLKIDTFSSGISLYNVANYNNITNNVISNSQLFCLSNYGISLFNSEHNSITHNYIYNNDGGIYIRRGEKNTILRNTIDDNSCYGIKIENSNSNKIASNAVCGHTTYDIVVSSGTGNYGDNFCDVLNAGGNSIACSKSCSQRGCVSDTHPGTVFKCGDTVTESCTFNFDLYCSGDGLVVGADNICIDGDGYSITGVPTGTGILGDGLIASGRNHVTIQNINIYNFYCGIHLFSSSDNILRDNTANSNRRGIYLRGQSNSNTITNNTANLNEDYGIYLSSSQNNTLTDNTANLNEDYGIYLSSSQNNTLTGNTANLNSRGIYLLSSSNNNTLTDNTADLNNYGIYFSESDYNNITENNITENKYGVQLSGRANNNLVNDNKINYNSFCGISIYNSDFNNIENNMMNNNGYAVIIDNSKNNWITNNNQIRNNYRGVGLSNSNSTLIQDNDISKNDNIGIYIYYANNNSVRNNTIDNNKHNGIYVVSSLNNRIIYANKITKNKMGIYLDANAKNTTIFENYICNNTDEDISNIGLDNIGWLNYCDNVYNWNDRGSSGGCMYSCGKLNCTDNDGDGYYLYDIFQCPIGNDCNDNNASINPGADEIYCNGVDEDCNAKDECHCVDNDDDGAPAITDTCPLGFDCDDSDPNRYPGAREINCNGIDENCDGEDQCDCTDNDGDGYAIEGGDCGLVDCNDNDINIHPNAAEIYCNGVDEDCDGNDDCECVDNDGDGYYATTPYCPTGTDCGDTNYNINPGKAEICYNAFDENCNGMWNEGCDITCTTDADCSDGRICDERNRCVCPHDELHFWVNGNDIVICDPIGVPVDTPCEHGWPHHEGSTVGFNEDVPACDLFEVTIAESWPYRKLWGGAKEARRCCVDYFENGVISPGCHYNSTEDAYWESGLDNALNYDNLKRCIGLYEIYANTYGTRYMQHYYYNELDCGRDYFFGFGIGCLGKTWMEYCCNPDERDDWCAWIPGPIDCYDGVHKKTAWLRCKDDVGTPDGWFTDDSIIMPDGHNICCLSDLPSHVSAGVLSTGTCADYSVVLTTILRMSGYKNDEVYSTRSDCPDYGGHVFNLIRFPGDSKYTLVDTVGNCLGGYHPMALPECTDCYYWNYEKCQNDNGRVSCPPKSDVWGRIGGRGSGSQEPPRHMLQDATSSSTSKTEGNITVTRTVYDEIYIGEIVRVNITIENDNDYPINVTVRESIAGAIVYGDLNIPGNPAGVDAPPMPYVEFLDTVSAHGKKSFTYSLLPIFVGHHGHSATEVRTDDNVLIYLDTQRTEVKCISDGVCNGSVGENYITCPQDCGSGAEDGICNPIADGQCDNDCVEGLDPDCQCVTPTDDLYINTDTSLCPGFYNILDAGALGVIIINADNVVLDCNGATINGTDSGRGIYNPGFKNVVVKNCGVMNYQYGIFLSYYSNDNQLINNTVTSNSGSGVYLQTSSGVKMMENTANSNRQGINLYNSSNNKLIRNTANSNDYGFYLGGGTYSSGNKLNWNTACDNKKYDFNVIGDFGSGDDNTCDKPYGWNDAGTTGCTYPCIIGKSDLIITEIVCDRENDKIGYEMKNIGDGAAPACHYTGLWVDGEKLCADHVDADLEPGQSCQGWFECYTWPECQTIEVKVCADIAGFVPDQVNDVETGKSSGCGTPPGGLGSLFQSFAPSASPLAAVDLRLRAGGGFPVEGYDTTVKIRSGTFDGAVLATATASVPGPQIPGTQLVVNFKLSSSIEVTPGETYVIEWISPQEGGVVLTWMVAEDDPYSGGTAFGCSGTAIPDEDFIFTTYTGVPDQVDESDEINNCLEKTCECVVPKKPDLVIKDIKLSGEGDYCYVDYQISNIGTASASASTTYLSVDDKKVASDSTGSLAPGAFRWDKFTAYRTTAAHAYKVCADGPNAISESSEANNCITEELTCQLSLDIYFADGGESPGSVYHYNTTTGIEEIVYTRPSRRLYSFTFHPHIPEKLYFVNANENKIYRTLQTSSGWTPEEVVYTHTTYVRDIAFAFGKDDELRLYFSEATGAGENGKIYKIEDGKAYLYYEVKLADVGGFWSGDFAFDDNGNLYLSSGNQIPASIYKVEEGKVKEIFKDEKEPIRGHIYADGTLYYANWGTKIYRLDISTGKRTVVYSNTKRTWLSDVDFRPELIG